ncbi:Uncharacterized protein M6B38_243205 [Iris pallida]|uniref:Uncharacterized protein n=1 Tax=Iris pallida TaxID=29817 RepID=A0AAX6DIL0_IRIPA|nr:Uncharacterized protein M6B38_243205 [Iris pallida]
MGFLSRKLFPACDNMCICCPALRPSSRRPKKRYKKLLAEIFPRTPDDLPNERKIIKLCEYAAKNPFRIPKIAKFLEERSYKELRAEHINFIKIITETYSKLLYICKEQMAYFAGSLFNVISELFDNKQHSMQILGCQTLTRLIYGQADSTYARNIESLVHKVCMLANEKGEEHKAMRAASLECLSSMVWFMTEYSCIFADFDEIIHAILQNYGIDERFEADAERRDAHHNWLDEVVRCEGRGVGNIANDVSSGAITIMPRPETRNSSMLTREERENPVVWSHICIQKLAELAKESTTLRRVLEPIFVYFDTGRHWATRRGLALHVLSEMSYLVESSGNEQMILAAIIRHLDHKNVLHDPQIKSDMVQIATILVRQLRPGAVVAEIGVASDLCRHLRKSLQATIESIGLEESKWNITLQDSIEDCLLEIAKGIGDAYPLYDLMAISLEKLPATATACRATIGSLLILAHIISLTSVHSCSQLVFPEALLLQLLKAMIHSDVETRRGAHRIFQVILVRSPIYPRLESEYLYGLRKWQSKSTSAFASATALLEKLRREKECLNADKHETCANNDIKTKNMDEEEVKHGRAWKASPYFHKLTFSVMDRIVTSTSSPEAETDVIILSEEQTAQLLSSFWMQANQPDNLPSNFEAISHSFSLTLLSSCLKKSCDSNTVSFFQLPLSLINASLDLNGTLSPSCQRSRLTLAVGMLAFAGKVFHITELTDSLKFLISLDVDPYLFVGDDLQIYLRTQSEFKEFGSDTDQLAATSALTDMRNLVFGSYKHLLDIIIQGLSSLTSLEKDELAKQLSETFTPEIGTLCGSIPTLDWENLQYLHISEESLSFDEEVSRTSSIDGDIVSQSPATDLPSTISRNPTSSSLPQVISIGQLLESALHEAGQVAGTSVSTSPLPYGTMTSQCESLARKKLSAWLVSGQDTMPDDPLSAPCIDNHSASGKMELLSMEQKAHVLRLPPASPFDNFMRAAAQDR